MMHCILTPRTACTPHLSASSNRANERPFAERAHALERARALESACEVALLFSSPQRSKYCEAFVVLICASTRNARSFQGEVKCFHQKSTRAFSLLVCLRSIENVLERCLQCVHACVCARPARAVGRRVSSRQNMRCQVTACRSAPVVCLLTFLLSRTDFLLLSCTARLHLHATTQAETLRTRETIGNDLARVNQWHGILLPTAKVRAPL